MHACPFAFLHYIHGKDPFEKQKQAIRTKNFQVLKSGGNFIYLSLLLPSWLLVILLMQF